MNERQSKPNKPSYMEDHELKKLLREYPVWQIDSERYVNRMIQELKPQTTPAWFGWREFVQPTVWNTGLAFGLCLIFIITVYSYWHSNSSRPFLKSVQWTTLNSDHVVISASWEKQLASGETVIVPEDTYALIHLVDGSSLLCSPQTEFSVHFDSLRNIHIQNGKVDIHAAHQLEYPMQVHTPISTIDVIGTRFTVELLPKQ